MFRKDTTGHRCFFHKKRPEAQKLSVFFHRRKSGRQGFKPGKNLVGADSYGSHDNFSHHAIVQFPDAIGLAERLTAFPSGNQEPE